MAVKQHVTIPIMHLVGATLGDVVEGDNVGTEVEGDKVGETEGDEVGNCVVGVNGELVGCATEGNKVGNKVGVEVGCEVDLHEDVWFTSFRAAQNHFAGTPCPAAIFWSNTGTPHSVVFNVYPKSALLTAGAFDPVYVLQYQHAGNTSRRKFKAPTVFQLYTPVPATDTKFHKELTFVLTHRSMRLPVKISLFSKPLIAIAAGKSGSVKESVFATETFENPFCG